MATQGAQHRVSEWGLVSAKARRDPFNEIEVDVVFTGEGGETWKVPAYWAGSVAWRVRFAPPRPGRYRFESVCSDASDAGLHGQTGVLEAGPGEGPSALWEHGPVRVSADRRYLEHADGTPYLWVGDTWWMGLTKRLDWPAGFRSLLEDRVRKGFNTIQIVAGPLPDFCATKATWDPQQANEAGWPWERDYARINPAFFDLADRRIALLVESGLMPCIVGMWGYYLPFMGVDRCRKHWRYLVARYGAYPVVWCLCGECTMPTYEHMGKPEHKGDSDVQKAGWTEVARYVRQIDPFRRVLTVHPCSSGRHLLRGGCPNQEPRNQMPPGCLRRSCLPRSQNPRRPRRPSPFRRTPSNSPSSCSRWNRP